jgi:DNA-directed RNA polymerase subunit omega
VFSEIVFYGLSLSPFVRWNWPRILRRLTEGGLNPIMRDEYIRAALLVVDDPNVLINVVSRRVKQLKRGNRALVESLEKLSAEDTALREIIERKISFELATPAEIAASRN